MLMKNELTPEQLQRYVAVLDEVERYRSLTEKEKEMLVRSIVERPYMDLRSDFAFKHVFQNLDLLKVLLDDLLPEDIEAISRLEHLPNEIDKMRPDDKNIIMDVLVKTHDGREIIIEMQRKKKTSFKNRMLYYGASMLHGQLKRRESYAKLKPVYVICFMDYEMEHETDQLVYCFALRETTSGERYGNHLLIYFCELPRLKKTSLEGLNPVESWFYILENMRKFAGDPKEMGPRYAAIAEASRMNNLPDDEKLKYFRGMVTEEERLDIGTAYYEDGFNDGKKAGLEQGLVRGKADGIQEATVNIAKELLAAGIDVAVISAVTGLRAEEISSL